MRTNRENHPLVMLAALGSAILSTASAAQATPSYSYVGCYADNAARDLNFQIDGNIADLTPARCAALCATQGQWQYFGVQDGNQCFCGDSYGSDGTSTSCDMTCSGDSTQTCGGSWANSVYEQLASSAFVGCYADSSSRDLPFQCSGGDSGMTAQKCQAECAAQYYAYSGVQYGDQCFCGDSYGSEGTSTSCDMACSGDSTETCGGSYANDVWHTGAVQPQVLPGNTISPGTTLYPGDMLYSPSKEVFLTMQPDGNLVVYFSPFGTWKAPVWGSATEGAPGAYAIFQPDGNLVVYTPTVCFYEPSLGQRVCSSPHVLWAAGTNGKGSVVTVQDDGNLVVYASNGSAPWAAGSNNVVPPSSMCYDNFCPTGTWWHTCSKDPWGDGYMDCNLPSSCVAPGAEGQCQNIFGFGAGGINATKCTNQKGHLDCTLESGQSVDFSTPGCPSTGGC